MKILVLNGSPKRDQSDTMHITRAFLEGMRRRQGISPGRQSGPKLSACCRRNVYLPYKALKQYDAVQMLCALDDATFTFPIRH